ncbi:MAG: hypothetical protein JRC92_10105 [Deltaproteobacteria bacterium]|nr:hypothetical protein [Deltaproteobacteria bacterium]
MSAQDVPQAQLPAIITSLGQSPDGFAASVLAKRAKLPIEFNKLLQPEDVVKYKTVIVAVGASLKGFGSAGINLDSELKRGAEIVKAAKENNVFLVILHSGGQGRREEMSNKLLDRVADQADFLVVVETGNQDGYFTNLSEEKNIPLKLVETVIAVQGVLKEMFPGE